MRAVDAIYNQMRPVILLALSALIPIILLCGVIALHFVREQRVELDKVFQDKAMTLAMALSRELETQINLLAILSETPRLDPPVSVQGFSEVTRRLQARLPLWNIIRVSDLNGTILVSVPPTNMAPGARVVDIGSHDKVVNTGKPTVGDMVKGPAGNLAFAVRVPVIRGERTISILSVVIQSSALDAVLRRGGLPENWTAWITDGKDQVVASSDPQFISKARTDFIQYAEQSGGAIRSGVLSQGLDVRVADATIEASSWTVHVAMPLSDYRILSWKAYSLFAVTLVATLMLSVIGIYLFQRELETRRRQEAAFESSQRLQALGKLTGQVAHDFNNLLMVFQAGTNAISRRLGNQDERLKLIFDSMFDGVARGKEMTQRLLSFSRRSDQGSKPLDLVRALRDLEPLLRQLANDSVVLEYEIDPRLWPVVADPKALEIAMVNLVTNAREAMPSGGVVTVRASNITNVSREVEGLTGAFVAIAISDTGSGMKPTLTSKAFDPLFSTKGPGAAGLGLTQVLTFAERSGGTAKLVSVEDVGTAVTLYLPRSQKEVEEEPPDTASAALPKRILIVDDTPSSLISARLSLEEEDIEILTAGSGPEALRILAQDRNIDLLLSDIMMPGMSGIELARETARLSEDIIILLMTGFSDQLEQGVKIEFPVLMKPFSQAELRAALKRAVKGKSGQA